MYAPSHTPLQGTDRSGEGTTKADSAELDVSHWNARIWEHHSGAVQWQQPFKTLYPGRCPP